MASSPRTLRPLNRDAMIVLHHSPLDAASRTARLCLAEYGLAFELVEEKPWERRTEFLAMNPAGTVPVMVEDGVVVSGIGPILEYLDETRGPGAGSRRLLPGAPAERAEVRRLLDWFLVKMRSEVSSHLVREKVTKRFDRSGESPDTTAIRAGKANLRYHLHYIGFLMSQRSFMAGDWLTVADLAAGAELSVADYLGDVPWGEDETAKTWYARIKSRPSFRALLAEQVAGISPPQAYTDLDF